MRDLDGWVKGWNLPELLSGVPEKGTQDARFLIALYNEINVLKGKDISGASIDVCKCFGQIIRDLARELSKMLGTPIGICEPHFNWIDDLSVRFQVGKISAKGIRIYVASRKDVCFL